MRGYQWFFAVAGLVGVSFLIANNGDEGARHDEQVVLARQAAIQGLNETAKKLVADSVSWSTNPDKYAFQNVSMGSVSYSTEIAAPYKAATWENGCAVDTVDVVSEAALENGDSHRVEATYVRTCGEEMGIRLVNFVEQ